MNLDHVNQSGTDPLNTISNSQSRLYGNLFNKHGASVDAVASGNQVYKNLRYKNLANLFSDDTDFSVHDVGFGLGHFWDFMRRELPERRIVYSGSEVTNEFVIYCQQMFPDMEFRCRDLSKGPYADNYDYLVFGGTFYHLAETPSEQFQEYMFKLIENAIFNGS